MNKYFLKFRRAIDVLDEIDHIRAEETFTSGDDVDPIIKLIEEMSEKEIPRFISQDTFQITHRGLVHVVINDKERERYDNGLMGHHVIIDDVEYLCKGVETFPTMKILKGAKLGLLVEELK